MELLTTVSEIYEKMERYEDSFEILNMAYDRAPIGRTIVYKMTEMAIQMGDFEEARDLYKEFVDMAPHDLSRYILKYKISRNRSRFWRSSKAGNTMRNGLMSWPASIIKRE